MFFCDNVDFINDIFVEPMSFENIMGFELFTTEPCTSTKSKIVIWLIRR